MIFLAGCSSEKGIQTNAMKLAPPASSSNVSSDTLTKAEMSLALIDSSAVPPESYYDSVTVKLLDRAREHYAEALNAEDAGDSVRVAEYFEFAIGILNELSYYPNIDSNQEFNDLSKAIIEDYEKYIASIDSLGPQTSIFALREKLNQIEEATAKEESTSTQIMSTTTIPLVMNGFVEKSISFYQTRGREHFERWLTRSKKYFPIMLPILREEGVPDELVFLSMVESGVNPNAQSWRRAVGLWQFIKGTGAMYGLKSNFWYDERRDFEKATRAAARHLKDLHREFGDWYVALAGYDCGAGNVRRAMRRSHSKDYWGMRRHLPRETRNYVAQYIAVAIMALDPKRYGFEVAQPDPLTYETMTINDCVDITILARCAGTDALTLMELNPELLKWCSPPGVKQYSLRIPVGTSETFKEKYASIPDDQKRNWIVHKVRHGETLSAIARKYGMSINFLVETNHLSNKRIISVGKELVIPIPASAQAYINSLADNQTEHKSSRYSRRLKSRAMKIEGKEKLVYNVKKGDVLSKIAEQYRVRASDLRMWNDISYGSLIHEGDVLTIWSPKKKSEQLSVETKANPVEKNNTLAERQSDKKHIAPHGRKVISYKVKKGDTLYSIASSFGVKVRDLKTWNKIRGSRIYPGQEIKINT